MALGLKIPESMPVKFFSLDAMPSDDIVLDEHGGELGILSMICLTLPPKLPPATGELTSEGAESLKVLLTTGSLAPVKGTALDT